MEMNVSTPDRMRQRNKLNTKVTVARFGVPQDLCSIPIHEVAVFGFPRDRLTNECGWAMASLGFHNKLKATTRLRFEKYSTPK
jgi:hypothetical protein